jgi:predicted nucleotidyltransferase
VRYADPERIRNAVRDFAGHVRAVHPEVRSIRWFGSWVSGTALPGSDVDLCIIVRKSSKPPRDRIADFLPRAFPVGLDLLVYTEEEYAALATSHPSMRKAIEAGVAIR